MQMRRAAVSIGANIAEGCCSSGDREFARYCQIAVASASELEYYLLLSHDLNLLDSDQHMLLGRCVTSTRRMLIAFVRTLRTEKGGL